MKDDTISRAAAIDAWKEDFKEFVNSLDMPRDDYKGIMEYIDEVPSAQSEQLSKINDLVEGTIDHFDKDDAMDLLYAIKGVLKNG